MGAFERRELIIDIGHGDFASCRRECNGNDDSARPVLTQPPQVAIPWNASACFDLRSTWRAATEVTGLRTGVPMLLDGRLIAIDPSPLKNFGRAYCGCDKSTTCGRTEDAPDPQSTRPPKFDLRCLDV